MGTTNDRVQLVTAVAAVIAAAASLWNAYQYAVLSGTVRQLSETLLAHINSPGIH